MICACGDHAHKRFKDWRVVLVSQQDRYWLEHKHCNAYDTMNGKRKCLGLFRDKNLAAAAYDRDARALHGEFAVTNQDMKRFIPTKGNIVNRQPHKIKA